MIAFLVTVASVGQVTPASIPRQELEYQQQAFEQWWGQPLELRLDQLPTDGSVPDYRTPYSGFDYPDRSGGTVAVMVKYDRAYNRGRNLATEFERVDVGAHKSRRGGLAGMGGMEMGRGLFGRLRALRTRGPNTPAWYGHCNGWTAAAIRHAEPQYNVVRNGVVFTPADIKGLLAEIYMYTDTEFLGGIDPVIHPAVFHLSMTNWLGRGAHPVGIEAAVGEVVVNYPAFSYKAAVTPRNNGESEVKLTVTYAVNTNGEAMRSPRYSKQMFFHYLLDTDQDGTILGGRYFSDSARIDMLWAPLQPIQGGKKGNERGNPHVDVETVLAIWRESVPEDIRQKWLNIDPPEEDRVILPDTTESIAGESIAGESIAGSTSAAPLADTTTGDNTAVAETAAGETPERNPSDPSTSGTSSPASSAPTTESSERVDPPPAAEAAAPNDEPDDAPGDAGETSDGNLPQ